MSTRVFAEVLSTQYEDRTHRKVENGFVVALVSEIAKHGCRNRLGNDGTVDGALGIVEQRVLTADSWGPLEEESHGERLEVVKGVAEVGESQLRFDAAVEETALARLTTVAGELDVLVEEPQTLRGRDGFFVFKHHTGDLLHFRIICEPNRLRDLHVYYKFFITSWNYLLFSKEQIIHT